MEYVDRLLGQTEYLQRLKELELEEAGRAYCKHGLSHLLDTARIMWILCLEGGLFIEKELVYLTALLHDIGRLTEYRYNIPHEQAGITLAESLLKQIAYTASDRTAVLQAIRGHRGEAVSDSSSKLGDILKKADKLSRSCFVCEAGGMCNWQENRKNKTIII